MKARASVSLKNFAINLDSAKKLLLSAIVHQFGVWQKNLLTLGENHKRIEQAATSMHSRRMATLEEKNQNENSEENEHKTRRRRRTARQRRDLSSESEESSESE